MKISKGRKAVPHLVLVHGLDGVGKTTLGSEFPDPIFIGPELGNFNIDSSRVDDVSTWRDFMQALRDLYKLKDGHKRYKTLVIDSLDWCEIMIMEHICREEKQPSIERCGGGYGKGYVLVKNQFLEMQKALNFLRDKGHNIVLICHSSIAEFNDPASDVPYSRYELKLFKAKSGNVDLRALWREFVDAVIFLRRETLTRGENKKEVRAETTGRILMELNYDAAWDAKNRFGIQEALAFKIGSGYKELNNAFKGGVK